MDAADDLRLEIHEDTAILTFRDEPRFNGISLANVDRAPDLIRDIGLNPQIRFLVFAGAPGLFCTGGSMALLREMAQMARTERIAILRRGQRWVNEVLASPCFTVAAVDGLAAGAGLDFMLAFDGVLLGPRARTNFWFGRLGAVPDQAGLLLLADRVGIRRTLEIYARSQTHDQAQTQASGLGEAVDQLPTDALQWSRYLRRRYPIERGAYQTCKTILSESLLARLVPHQAAIREAQADIIGEPAFQDRIERAAMMQRVLLAQGVAREA